MSDSLFGFTSSFIVPTVVSIAVGTTPITSGSNGRILFDDAGVVGETNGAFWNKVNGWLGIGTGSPLGVLHLKQTASTTRMVMDGDAGQSKIITFRTNGLQRFGFYLNNIAESGSNAGSDFAIRAYSDAGTLLSTPLYIHRDTGNIGVNTTLDSGFKFDVNGSARATSYTLGNFIINQSSANQFIVSNPAGASGQLFLYGGNTTQANIQIFGSSGGSTNNILFNVGSTTRAMIAGSTGNFLVNTTVDAGFKADINGTMRVQGNVSVLSGSTITIGNLQIFDNTSGPRQINALANQGLQLTASSTSITLNNSAGSTGSIVLLSTGSDGRVYLRPNATSQGIAFGGSQGTPSFNQMTFINNRSDGVKSAIINTVDFSSSGNPPINLFIYPGKETASNNQANLILCHDGTTARGNTLIGTTTNVASAIVNVDSTTQGFLPPRMTSAQRTAISSPAIGLVVYQTDATEGIYLYKSSGWALLL